MIHLHNIKQHKVTWKTKTIKWFERRWMCNIWGTAENNYKLAIKSVLNSPTIFLTLPPNEIRINNYVTRLKAWRVNMDIQFVLNGAQDRSKTGRHFLKHFSLPHWRVLRKPWHSKKVPLKKNMIKVNKR